MFRLRSKSGDESVFRSPEEIRSALLSGFVTPDAQIWDAVLKGWVPLLEHSLYQQIAATPGGRKSGVVKGPPAGGPPVPKPPAKLVIKRPGDVAPTAMPPVNLPVPTAATPKPPTPPPPPPQPRPPVAPDHELPDLELLDIGLTPDPEPIAPPPPAPKPPVVAAPIPPAPVPVSAGAPRSSTPQMSAPQVSTPVVPAPIDRAMEEEEEPAGGSKKWIVIGAVVVLAAVIGGFALMSGKGAPAPAPVDSALVSAPVVAPVDTTPRDSTTPADSVRRADSLAAAAAPVDTARPVVAAPAPRLDSTPAAPAAPGIAPLAFAPVVARGPTPWTARPVVGAPLTIPALEVVRLRYLAAQSRALAQFEAGLEAAGFADLFDPSRVSTTGRREESLDAVDAGRSALREFRRRQTAIDFAYADSMRLAMPPGSDTPDFRTFGPILRETPAQSALTDSIVGEAAEVYGMLVGEAGGYTFRAGMLTWRDADNAERYRTLQERLTSQIARVRTRPPAEVPPALAAVLRGIGLPR